MELVRAPKNWYDSRDRLADLAEWLREQGREPSDFAYFLRKPWKWTAELRELEREEREAELERLAAEDAAHERYAL